MLEQFLLGETPGPVGEDQGGRLGKEVVHPGAVVHYWDAAKQNALPGAEAILSIAWNAVSQGLGALTQYSILTLFPIMIRK